jgi:hypothetical protein
MFLNTLFGLNLRYYNHYVLHRKKNLDSIDIYTNSYAFQAEVLIKLIKFGYSYVEVGVRDRFDNDIHTKAFYFRNVLGVMQFFLKMINEIYFKNNKIK